MYSIINRVYSNPPNRLLKHHFSRSPDILPIFSISPLHFLPHAPLSNAPPHYPFPQLPSPLPSPPKHAIHQPLLRRQTVFNLRLQLEINNIITTKEGRIITMPTNAPAPSSPTIAPPTNLKRPQQHYKKAPPTKLPSTHTMTAAAIPP